jgi:pimeloyl-ACP methyl ester carboxylesterase
MGSSASDGDDAPGGHHPKDVRRRASDLARQPPHGPSPHRGSRFACNLDIPNPRLPLPEAAVAKLNPWTEDKVDSKNPKRGPMLIISGELDHTVPWSISNASYKREKRNEGITEIVKIPGRGHALTIDAGWREVADTALGFIKRFM